MRIRNIKVKNFLSYKEFELDFDKGLCLIEGWNFDDNTSNGAAKTAIMDSIAYCIWGQLPRETKVDEVINEKTKKNESLEIVLTIEDNDELYTIKRTRRPNDLELLIKKDNQTYPIKGQSIKETQELISHKLGLSYNIFVNSVYFTQNAKATFVSSNDDLKKNILTTLLDLSYFDKAYKYIKETHLKRLEKVISDLNFKIDQLKGFIEKYTSDIKYCNLLASQFDKEKQEKITKKKEYLETKISKFREYEQEIVNEEKIKAKLDNLLNQKEVIQEIKDKCVNLNNDISLLQRQTNHLEDKKEKFTKKQEGKCSECGSIITKEHLANEIENINKELQQYKAQEFEKKSTLKEYNKMLMEVEKIENKMIEYRRNLDLIVEIKKYKADLKVEIDALNNEIFEIEKEENNYTKMIENKQKELDQFNLDLSNNGQKLHTSIQEFTICTKLREIYKNIKYYIFVSVVNELNNNINKYLSVLFDSDVSVVFNTETKNYKGEVKQKFSTDILKDGYSRSFNTLSNGEQKRVELATNFALSDIVANRSSKNLNILLLDEIMQGIDTEGQERVVDLLKNLARDRENIFIIDHNPIIKDLISNKIRVEKKNGISKIC